MKPCLLVAAIGLALSGCATTSALKPSERPPMPSLGCLSISRYPLLKTQLDSTLSVSLFPPANVGIKIVSLTTGESLYELNPAMLFTPASNEKLFTSASALLGLGKGFSFSTVVSVDRKASRIFVKGSGDPLLSTSDLDSLARIVKGRLAPESTWTIVGDVSYFDDLPWGEGWMWDDEGEDYNMAISPLSVNSNAIKVQVRPGKLEDSPVRVSTIPPTAYVTIENTATTPVDTPLVPLKVSRKWRERSNTIVVTGQKLNRDSMTERTVSVWQPDRYALTLLAERLQTYGIKVGGIAIDTIPPTAEPLAQFSRGLDSVLTYMNKTSDNLSAENLLKTLSAERNARPGTTKSGTSIMKQYLASTGVDTTTLVLADGSGLSRYNLVSPDATVRVLVDMSKRDSVFTLFYNSLPIAGTDGTLQDRLKGTPAQGNLRAKTGTLSGVSALSGYVTTADGEMLAFAIFMSNYASSSRSYRDVQDRIGVILSRMSRRNL